MDESFSLKHRLEGKVREWQTLVVPWHSLTTQRFWKNQRWPNGTKQGGQFSEGDPFGSLFLLDPFGSRKSLASLWAFPNQLPEPIEIFSTPLKTFTKIARTVAGHLPGQPVSFFPFFIYSPVFSMLFYSTVVFSMLLLSTLFFSANLGSSLLYYLSYLSVLSSRIRKANFQTQTVSSSLPFFTHAFQKGHQTVGIIQIHRTTDSFLSSFCLSKCTKSNKPTI